MSARASSSGSRKSADSARSTDSYASVLSEDSYLETFKPIDAEFKKFLDAFERDILMARKVQSHNLKKRDQKDTERRTDWTDAMEKAYAAYKNKVDMLSKAKKTQEGSELAAKKSSKKSIKEQEAARNKALADDEAWLLAGIAFVSLPNHPLCVFGSFRAHTSGRYQSRRCTARVHEEIPRRLEHPYHRHPY